jgi:hypothetical protein
MTFTLTLVNQYGIWQSSDFRLTLPVTQKIEDDYSRKQIKFRCSDGAALLTYAGLGSVEGLGIADWIRQFIRGDTLTVDQTLIKIRERATEDIGDLLHKHNFQHMFSIGAFLGGASWVVQIRNFSLTEPTAIVQREFHTVAKQIPIGSAVIVPWPNLVSTTDFALLRKVSPKRPRKAKEFCKLFGEINLRIAAVTVPLALIAWQLTFHQ